MANQANRPLTATPTATDAAAKQVERMLHDAHLRYQRQQQRADRVEHVSGGQFPVSELRGLRYEQPRRPVTQVVEFKPEWFTHVRPNTLRAFIESQIWYAAHLR